MTNNKQINKVAVIGSGVMGSGIAAHIANSGTDVLILDIVPNNAQDRNILAKNALEKIKKSDPEMLMHKSKLKNISLGNIEDDLAQLKSCDWIIEVVLEDINVKKDLYKKIVPNLKGDAVISSNTSTIPLYALTADMDNSVKERFMITHFFNPARYMKLLELVYTPDTSKEAVAAIRHFCDIKLGKGVVDCYDKAGFIANRIGTYWMSRTLKEVMEQKASLQLADVMMGQPLGIPKTGVFGLMDLIGIDLLPLIAKSFAATLDANDDFNRIYSFPPVIEQMIADGYTGRKGKGGFYKLEKADGGKKVKLAKNLQTGDYEQAIKPKLDSVSAARKSLADMVNVGDEGSKLVWPIMRDTIIYTANLVGEIAENILDIDKAMKLGYNWKYGIFELLDKFACKDSSGNEISGAKWFASRLQQENIAIPELIAKLADSSAYRIEAGKKYFFTTKYGYQPIEFDKKCFNLADIKLNSKPILKNSSAALWDIGDGVCCFEFTSKMNSLDPMTLELIVKSVAEVQQNHKALVIYNDSDNFCVGANIGVLLFAANVAAWKEIDGIIKQGQDAYMALKYAPFPVVGAPSGMALGGGCEILLHCDAVQAHAELYTGLVEVGVGLVPGWGGCKELIMRELKSRAASDAWAAKFGGWFSWLSPVRTLNTMPAVTKAMTNISMAKVSKSAMQAKDMLILNEKSSITMNRERLLADAKEKAISMIAGYAAPKKEEQLVRLPGKTARTAIQMHLDGVAKSGNMTPYDMVVSKAVATVLSGGETDITEEISEQQLLDLEREEFVKLVKDSRTLDRIEHMLDTGKPLRN